MNSALRVDDHLYLRWWQAEETAGFDDFEPFVHQRGGIDSDALAHLPGGMIERLLNGDGIEGRDRRPQEGAAGGSQPDGFYFVHPPAAHAFVDSIVFAVDGKQRFALLERFGGDQFAGSDQTFFVRQADGLACSDCFVSGFESGHANDGTDHKINFWMSGNAYRAGAAVQDFDGCVAGFAKA